MTAEITRLGEALRKAEDLAKIYAATIPDAVPAELARSLAEVGRRLEELEAAAQRLGKGSPAILGARAKARAVSRA